MSGSRGLLLYRYSDEFDKGYFIQAIEGPIAAHHDLRSRISGDSQEGTEDERMFPNWSISFKNVEPGVLVQVAGFGDIEKDRFWRNLTSGGMPEAPELLKGFAGRLRAQPNP